MATQKKDWCGNKRSTWATLGASNHTERARAEHDYYATDPTAVEKLLSVETPSKQIWECAVGEGHLADALKARGYVVYASDVVDRGYPSTRVADFLTASQTPFESGGGYSYQPAVQIRNRVRAQSTGTSRAGTQVLHVFAPFVFRRKKA